MLGQACAAQLEEELLLEDELLLELLEELLEELEELDELLLEGSGVPPQPTTPRLVANTSARVFLRRY